MHCLTGSKAGRVQRRRFIFPGPKTKKNKTPRRDATCLSDHAVPNAVDLLPVLPVGDEVKVVGEADDLGQPLEDVDAEALAALFHGGGAFVVGTVGGAGGSVTAGTTPPINPRRQVRSSIGGEVLSFLRRLMNRKAGLLSYLFPKP